MVCIMVFFIDNVCCIVKVCECEYKFFDGDGFYLFVKFNGCKGWWFRYVKFDGCEGLILLGNYLVVGLVDVCYKCLEFKQQFVNGIDFI